MHSFQLAIEDFAVKNTGTYPVAGDNAAVAGELPERRVAQEPVHGREQRRDVGLLTRPRRHLRREPAVTTGYTIKAMARRRFCP